MLKKSALYRIKNNVNNEVALSFGDILIFTNHNKTVPCGRNACGEPNQIMETASRAK